MMVTTSPQVFSHGVRRRVTFNREESFVDPNLHFPVPATAGRVIAPAPGACVVIPGTTRAQVASYVMLVIVVVVLAPGFTPLERLEFVGALTALLIAALRA